jgi:hypothetical protein
MALTPRSTTASNPRTRQESASGSKQHSVLGKRGVCVPSSTVWLSFATGAGAADGEGKETAGPEGNFGPPRCRKSRTEMEGTNKYICMAATSTPAHSIQRSRRQLYTTALPDGTLVCRQSATTTARWMPMRQYAKQVK